MKKNSRINISGSWKSFRRHICWRIRENQTLFFFFVSPPNPKKKPDMMGWMLDHIKKKWVHTHIHTQTQSNSCGPYMPGRFPDGGFLEEKENGWWIPLPPQGDCVSSLYNPPPSPSSCIFLTLPFHAPSFFLWFFLYPPPPFFFFL